MTYLCAPSTVIHVPEAYAMHTQAKHWQYLVSLVCVKVTYLCTPATVVHVFEGLQLFRFQEGLNQLQASSMALMPHVCHVTLWPNHGSC